MTLIKTRKFCPSLGLTVELNVRKHWGTVGVILRRDDEDGTFAVQLGAGSFYLSCDAWAWDAPRGSLDEWELSAQIHGGRLWLSPGRMPWMKGKKDWPHSYALPWFEWKHVGDAHVETKRGMHPYTYQWKYQPATVQQVAADVTESSRTWRLHFAGLPLPFRRTRRFLWADFSEELGDERDSWKGGTTGASFELNPGEEWRQGLLRMQKERTFCRGK